MEAPELFQLFWFPSRTWPEGSTIWQLAMFKEVQPFFSGFPGGQVVKNLLANGGDLDLIPGSGRSPGEGNGNPLHCSCLVNSMSRGAWRAAIHGVAESWTWRSDQTTTTTAIFQPNQITDFKKCKPSCVCLDEHTTDFFSDFTSSDSSNTFWRTERVVRKHWRFCGKAVLSPLHIKF